MKLNQATFSKCIMNKVEFDEEYYLRVYNIDRIQGREDHLINTRLFKEVLNGVYLPVFLDKDKDFELIERLRRTDINEDILMSEDEVRLFLVNMRLYIESTYENLKNYLNNYLNEYELLVYKEYLNVFYAALKKGEYIEIVEVRVNKDGEVNLISLEEDLIEAIVYRDLYKHLDKTSDVYIKTPAKNYIVITKLMSRKSFVSIKRNEDNTYKIDSIRLVKDFREDAEIDFDKALNNLNYVLGLNKKYDK